MEKINRPSLESISELRDLYDNWEKWGKEYEDKLSSARANNKKVSFDWKCDYKALREQLERLTYDTSIDNNTPRGHCSFCDDHPIGTNSKETIEHYFPKTEHPAIAYHWENLYYCCDKCQSNANKLPFQETLRPDATDYNFKKHFWFDSSDGRVKIHKDQPKDIYSKCNFFLKRYSINDDNEIASKAKRIHARKLLFKKIISILKDPNQEFIRDDFEFRYVFDAAKDFTETK